jgi:hypothetical protein
MSFSIPSARYTDKADGITKKLAPSIDEARENQN